MGSEDTRAQATAELSARITACRICAERFAATATRHSPRPVAWFAPGARLRIVGQAPGMRVHETGLPFNDASGDRLRDWMGVDRKSFYDKTQVAITPMAFCFPGYDAKGADLPPPRICAATWHDAVDAALAPALTLLVGGYAQRRYLGTKRRMTDTVASFADHGPGIIPLPHPSWRNTGWLKKNPWFEADLLPVLRTRVAEVLG
ncbi:uracil-DNA glycosylase family protein [Maritimibacter sp. DP1N21-5]|uniref:uracil-DNA glycosylase family protein n=1 Tax=Maritimibacter sp. DP1N21-5 TaxID=2836867 RepID=UPI001C488F4A|nr:uracil-DNA glycosylase family protein [Maritimibacter sp. DP1N21-5]MBV7409183.1 uracil-DNA glycosylase family protein [Maritimibacter sp. DP1N21-5]